MRTRHILRAFGSFSLFAAIAAASLVASPREAHACGGTFCDGGPQFVPVDQKGENILFVMDGESVEAHIQIQYKGDAHRFAWVLPLQALPELSVGSQALFDALLQGSVPQFGQQTQFMCQNGGPASGGGTGGSFGGGGAAGGGGGDGEGPKVVLKETVGAFDVTVLQGGTAKEVIDWLDTNGYAQNPAAEPLLQKYLEKNYLFAAVKLVSGQGVDEIHPLVVKYKGSTPCVPLELTAIAAVEDMGVRTFFLGQERVVPTNYKHIELNPVRLNWVSSGANYNEVVSKAADSAVADGHAFVTEYAGTSQVVSPSGLWSASWNAQAFTSIEPTKVVDELNKQSLISCYPDGTGSVSCGWGHSLLAGLVHQYLPVPAGVSEGDFYSCLSCYKDQIDTKAWNGTSFAKDFQTRIVDPGLHATDLLKTWPYLTRLFTTISPGEMTSDPDFVAVAGLKDVTNTATSINMVQCNNRRVVKLPDGREVALPVDNTWPAWTDEMPWVETISDLSASSGPVELVSKTAKIDELLKAWNASQGWPPSSGAGGSSGQQGAGGTSGTGKGGSQGAGATAGGGSGSSTGGTTGAGASSGTGGSSSAQPAADAPKADDPNGGCSMASTGSLGGAWLAAAVGLGLLGRRRRRG